MSYVLEKVKFILNKIRLLNFAFLSLVFAAADDEIQISEKDLGFKIPTFSEILTSLIQLFFVIAGLAALFMLLTGALAWVTSGGNKENVEKARDKITQALVGIILIIIVLAIIWSLEQIVFGGNLCFGLSCRIKVPSLLKAL